MPKSAEMPGVLYIENDYSSKIVLESSRNPQSNKLNMHSSIHMMTFRALFQENGGTTTLSCHVFQQDKDAYGAWKTGLDIILNELKKRGIEIERVVKVRFNRLS